MIKVAPSYNYWLLKLMNIPLNIREMLICLVCQGINTAVLKSTHLRD